MSGAPWAGADQGELVGVGQCALDWVAGPCLWVWLM